MPINLPVAYMRAWSDLPTSTQQNGQSAGLVQLGLFQVLSSSLVQFNFGLLRMMQTFKIKNKTFDVFIFCSIFAGRFKSLFSVQCYLNRCTYFPVRVFKPYFHGFLFMFTTLILLECVSGVRQVSTFIFSHMVIPHIFSSLTWKQRHYHILLLTYGWDYCCTFFPALVCLFFSC